MKLHLKASFAFLPLLFLVGKLLHNLPQQVFENGTLHFKFLLMISL